MSSIDGVRSEVMSWPASERASLAHELILSLDDPAACDLGPEREAEIQRRLKTVREGTAEGHPAAAVFANEAPNRVVAVGCPKG